LEWNGSASVELGMEWIPPVSLPECGPCFFPLTTDAAAGAVGGARRQRQDAECEEEKWEQGDGMLVGALSLSGGMRRRCGGRWGMEKVSELILVARTSHASREWPNRPFLGSHPNPPQSGLR